MLKGRPAAHDKGFHRGYSPNRRILTATDRAAAVASRKKKTQELYASSTWDDLPRREKYRRVLSEQGSVCLWCGISEWNSKKITLEIDHVNGQNKDNSRENLRYLCPNCHSQTPTFRNKKRTPL